jgi:hypothetical protein
MATVWHLPPQQVGCKGPFQEEINDGLYSIPRQGSFAFSIFVYPSSRGRKSKSAETFTRTVSKTLPNYAIEK